MGETPSDPGGYAPKSTPSCGTPTPPDERRGFRSVDLEAAGGEPDLYGVGTDEVRGAGRDEEGPGLVREDARLRCTSMDS